MPKNLNHLFSLLFFILFNHFFGFAQLENNGITVRFNHKLLDYSKIDDLYLKNGSISDFLSPEGKKVLNDPKFALLRTLKFSKIFDNLRTCDSISISRTGEIVYIPPFWATFNVKTNQQTGLSYSKILSYFQDLYPLVIYAHPNFDAEFLSVPNDSLYPLQRSLHSNTYPNGHINVENAWDEETGKRFIKVGVFDSGIDTTHVDLKSKVLTGRGYNRNPESDSTSWGTDSRGLHGHGTPVAGIIGAKRNNITGIAGIAGGDGTDTSGVSLIDFRLSPGANGENISKAIIDGARSVGTYYDWSQSDPTGLITEEYYWAHASGYGINIGNHSYYIRVQNVLQSDTVGSGKDNSDSTEVVGPTEIPPIECKLCREAFLFSFQNGVINVCASGNGILPISNSSDYYTPSNYFPQNYDDTWLIQVGGSGTNGEWFDGTNGLAYETNYFARANTRMDVIAPFTNALIYSTASTKAADSISLYSTFSGTSAASPHVAGVAALLLSKYNQNCYSNSNLDVADVEYILEQSARDVGTTNFDNYTGYGLVDAYEALKMIDFPEFQIIHPDDDPISRTITDVDTLTLFLNKPIYPEAKGPIGSTFPLEIETFYDVERLEYELVYDFSNYILPTTQLLDVWARPSVTNSLQFFSDTAYIIDPNNSSNYLLINDTFALEPHATIVSATSNSISFKGYYYHFIGKHLNSLDPNSPIETVNDWYPINPNINDPKMAYSIYVQDSLAPFYTLPCYAENPPFDSLASVKEIKGSPEIGLFPNPGSQLTVTVNVPVSSIEISAIDGVSILTYNSLQIGKNFVKTFDCTNLANGVYIVTVNQMNGQVSTKKWIKI